MESVNTCVAVDVQELLRSIRGNMNNYEENNTTQSFPNTLSRRRQSLLSNYNNKYAYSRTKKIIHDRDCRRVREIPDVDFEMMSEFDRSMNTCPDCYRKAVVRYGIGDNRKKA